MRWLALNVVLLTTIVLASASTLAAEVFDFKGLRLGAPLSEVQRGEQYECHKADARLLTDITCTLRPGSYITIAGVPVSYFTLDFLKGRLVFIYVDFSPDQFDDVLTAMVEKYKALNRRFTSQLQNRYGAKFTNVQFQWENAASTMTLERFASSLDSSKLHLALKSAEPELARRA